MSDERPTIHIDQVAFAKFVEGIAILHRNGTDAAGLMLLCRVNLSDIAHDLRDSLAKQADRDGYRLVVEGFDELTKPMLLPADSPLRNWSLFDMPKSVRT